jgi:predicted AAA+ superfamily ATPase
LNRKITTYLLNWLTSTDRKPLIIRGARQVGKTWLVRDLAAKTDRQLLELNFERDSTLKILFNNNDPKKILIALETFFNLPTLDPQKTLLFLDEIQAAPELLAKLRWFYEELPSLPIIAAGSLLDFTLENHQFSMPVGRISYAYLEPMSFKEFLLAINQNKLFDFLTNYQLGEEIPLPIHELLWSFLREYIVVGGLPAAVQQWIEYRSFVKVSEIQQNLLTTYRDDFAKYAKKIPNELLNETFKMVPKLLATKFTYKNVNREVRSELIKKALNLLCKAKVCHKVHACSANAVPLDAEIHEKIFKVIFLDVGLACASLKLNVHDLLTTKEWRSNIEGEIAEQLVGQLLQTIEPEFMEPNLYYWVREEPGSQAEVDYIIQQQGKLVPIEVKAGSSGSLRSLHIFMNSKKLDFAVRFNSEQPNITQVTQKNYRSELVQYKLLSLPLYMVEELPRLIAPRF